MYAKINPIVEKNVARELSPWFLFSWMYYSRYLTVSTTCIICDEFSLDGSTINDLTNIVALRGMSAKMHTELSKQILSKILIISNSKEILSIVS